MSAIGCVPSNADAAPKPLSLLPLASPQSLLQVSAKTPLTLVPIKNIWDLDQYDSLYLKLENPGKESITVWARVENPDAKGVMDSARSALVLEPGKTATMRLRLMRRPLDPTYEPFKPFYMYTKNINVRDNTIDASTISKLVLWLEAPGEGQTANLRSIEASGQANPGPTPFLPFVDKYGQYIHADWPDKIYTEKDFAERLKKEEAEMSAYPGPSDWDKWGGWKSGPKQEPTGFFYPKKVDGKWWLVDPDGSLYWSYGPTGVGAGGDQSPITGKESWFSELPPAEGSLGRYWGKGKNARYMYYQDKEYRSYDFSSANAERKYGQDWRDATKDFMHRRLRNWGFNTIGNWSDSSIYLQDKTPYVVAIHYGGPWLDHIPDVFDPEFEKVLNARMDEEKGKTANDPWNIGYFVDNELAWGYMDKAELAVRGALRAAPTSVSKQTLIADLRAKYTDVAALNTAWGSEYTSWEAMLGSKELPDVKNSAARSVDLGEFGLKFAEKYFTTARNAVKRVAPNNLYLGVRFHGHIDTAIVQIAAKYVDVISWNVYEEPGARLNRFIGVVDKPFIVGEFGIGSDVGQTPFRGDTLSEDPMDRVHKMEKWVRQAAVHPLMVGAHYFQFRDQPITARGDGEAVLRGFVNIADTPHFELVQANRRFGYKLYQMRSGQ